MIEALSTHLSEKTAPVEQVEAIGSSGIELSRAALPAIPSLTPEDQAKSPGTEQSRWGKITRSEEEQKLLEGPRGRLTELWSALRVFAEFIKGFRALHFVGPCVTVFGSARFNEGDPYYDMAREVGRLLAEKGFAVMTGGGPGIMEAANRGAKDAGGVSIGSNIKLPQEQEPNKYLDKWVEFDHFFVRKAMLQKYSYGFIAMPGGYGTLDEIFETSVLIQTGKIKHFPMILMGKSYWAPMLDFLKESLLKRGAIDPADLNNIIVTDSPQEAVDKLYSITTQKFGLKHTPAES